MNKSKNQKKNTSILSFYIFVVVVLGSSVAYSVAVGLILAIGKEVTGRIPKGNIVDVEALLCGSPENFTALMKTCMNIQR